MRAFWIVLDSAGIGNAPDAEAFGDKGSNRALGDGRYDISETISGISRRIPEGCAG